MLLWKAGKNDSRKAIEEKEAAIIAIQKEIESSKEDDHQLEEEIQKTDPGKRRSL